MNGAIERIIAYPEKSSRGIELSEGFLMENLGLKGDFHAAGGDRQVSLLFAESREQLALQKSKGLCFLRFKENLSIRANMENSPGLEVFEPGILIEAGGALLEITGETKRCHEECELYRAGKTCLLTGSSLFARVVRGGTIRAGDSVTIKMPS